MPQLDVNVHIVPTTNNNTHVLYSTSTIKIFLYKFVFVLGKQENVKFQNRIIQLYMYLCEVRYKLVFSFIPIFHLLPVKIMPYNQN